MDQLSPSPKRMLNHIDEFENLCLGNKYYSPSKFREINEELSIGAVLMLGKHRYEKSQHGERLFWKGLDNREYDMGLTHETRIMRDYPGFNSRKSKPLGSKLIKSSKVIASPNGKGNISVVTMKDGSEGIGPNFRIALRNASLKMHLKSRKRYKLLLHILRLLKIKS